jgi:hypothetical protein
LKELRKGIDRVHSGENQFEVPKIEKLNNEEQKQDPKPLLVGKERDGIEIELGNKAGKIENSDEKQKRGNYNT